MNLIALEEKALSYIAQEHARGSIANPRTVMPLYSATSTDWAVGTALGNAELAQIALAAMKPDVFRWRGALVPSSSGCVDITTAPFVSSSSR